jgi:hypothetical protein
MSLGRFVEFAIFHAIKLASVTFQFIEGFLLITVQSAESASGMIGILFNAAFKWMYLVTLNHHVVINVRFISNGPVRGQSANRSEHGSHMTDRM